MTSSSSEMQTCISNCQTCHASCTQTAVYCLTKGGQHSATDHIKLILDCAQSCATCTDFMLRGSTLHMKECEICAVICSACAESCEKMDEDDQIKDCAAACRACADSCEKMSAAA